jgi:hypothetical protein
MQRLLVLCFPIFFSLQLFAQPSDILSVKKKNGLTLKNFYAGSRISFQTSEGYYVEGPIENIRNDSVFIRMYVTQRYQTSLGIPHTDTVHTEVQKFHYKDIASIQVSHKEKFLQTRLPIYLMAGGGSYIFLNLGNSLVSHYSITEKNNLHKLEIAGGLAAIGLLIRKLFPAHPFTTKKDRIEYIRIIPSNKPA